MLPGGWIGFVRWHRRVRSLDKSGWRHGRAEIIDGRCGLNILDVRFSGGEAGQFRVIRPVLLSLPVDAYGGAEVWIGGTGRHVTAMFRYGPFLSAVKPQ